MIEKAFPGKKIVLNSTQQFDSMLVTDVGDEMRWQKLWAFGDGIGRFRHQHHLSFNISVGH